MQISSFQSADCITSTYGTLVQYFGGQPAIFGSHWGYRPGSANDGAETWPFERLNASRLSPCELLTHWYALDVAWTRHPDFESAWQQIKAALDAREPVIVVADAFHLSYCWQFQTQHSPHRIVLSGYANSDVEISDGYRGSPHQGSLPLSEVRSAMTSTGLLYPRRLHIDGRNTVISLPRPAAALPVSDERQIVDAIGQNVLGYLTGGKDGVSGHDLLVGCAREIRQNAAELAGRITTDVSEVGAWFGGMASQRTLNAGFLHWAVETLAMPALQEHAEEALAIARRWEKLRNYFYIRLGRTSRRKSAVDGHTAVEHIADMIDQNASHEMSWCEALDATVGSLSSQRS